MKSVPADIFYVWHLPVRITHWVNVAAFFALTLTGLAIELPLTAGHVPIPMLALKTIHQVAGYALAAGVAVRIYWAFVGDRGASWRSFFPFLKQGGWSKIVAELRFYAFLRRDPPASSAVVNMSHLLVLLAFVVEVSTGFALLGAGGSHGIAVTLFGWLFWLIAPQDVRLIHVTVMWFLIAFTVEHVYITVLLDCRERSGLMSSIVTGYMGHERHS
jgi:Ni/Fe-hydrogenase 1 B-type cytochrome subunit